MFPQARAAIKYLVADAQKAIKAKNDGKTEGKDKMIFESPEMLKVVNNKYRSVKSKIINNL